MIDIQFGETSLDLKIVDLFCNTFLLNLPQLSEKIEPENSSWRLRNKKISITLKKWIETTWRELIRKKDK
jgi:hypothetical protein